MRYWVYINDKVSGPFEQEKIVKLAGFTPQTLVCSEIIQEGEAQEWIPAENVLDNLKQPVSSQGQNNEELVKKIDSLSQEIGQLRKDIEVFMLTQATVSGGVHAEDVPTATTAVSESRNTHFPAAALAEREPANAPKYEEPKLTDVPALKPSEVDSVENIPAEQEAQSLFKTPTQTDPSPVAAAPVIEAQPAAAPAEEKKESIVDTFVSDAPVVPELEVKPFGTSPAQTTPFSAAASLNPIFTSEPEPAAAPAIKPEAAAEPVIEPAPAAESAPQAAPAEDEDVIASALDSLYKTPAQQPRSLEAQDIFAEKELSMDAPEPSEIPAQAEIPASVQQTLSSAEIPVQPAYAAPQMTAEPAVQTRVPGEVQEVSLDEATSLISDFIPPNSAGGAAPAVKEIKGETSASSQPGGMEEGLPPHVITAPLVKRVKPSDIKTSPLLARSDRPLSVTEELIGGSNAAGPMDMVQEGNFEDDGYGEKKSPLKKIFALIIVLFIVAAAYLGAVFMKMLPDTFGLFNKNISAPVTAAPTPVQGNASGVPSAPVMTPESEADFALESAKDYVLPSGATLLELISARHPMVSDLVSWSVEKVPSAGNGTLFSITAAVPPEREGMLANYYRFDYDVAADTLTPTTTESRNILTPPPAAAAVPALPGRM